MKRIRLSYMRILALILATSTFACKENLQEQEFTPEEKETEMIIVSDELTQFTLNYDPENTQGLDAAIEKVKEQEYVESVIKANDHIKVSYKDGLTIYYPFILPSVFESNNESTVLASLVSGMGDTQVTRSGDVNSGGFEIFDFNSENTDRSVQTLLLKAAGQIGHEQLDLADYYGNIYHGKEMVTASNIEKAISNQNNKIVVISAHGIEDGILTNDTVKYGEAHKDPSNEYFDINETDVWGNKVLNRIWRPTQYKGNWYCDMVYFSGCGVFTPAVCYKLENYFEHTTTTSSLIVGWDNINSIGEASFLAMMDCFAQGMSFMDFYNQEGSHQERSLFRTTNMVYTGSKMDFKLSDKSWDVESFPSHLLHPSHFCHETIERWNQVRTVLDDAWRQKGTFHIDVYDVARSTHKKSSTFIRETGYDWFDQLISSSDWSVSFWLSDPGVYRVSLYYKLDKSGREILIDQKYLIKENGFKSNDVGEDNVPDIKLATVVTDAANLLYGCQVAVCPDDLIEQGFKVWERDNPSEMMDIQGTPHQDNSQVFQASLNGLKAGTKYQAKAFVKYITGDEFTGNVVEFTASSGSSTDPSVPIPEAVDLGLSVKWASFNLGASKPEEYGDFYAWGETECKDYYWWDTYKWGDMNSLTKYNSNGSQGVVDNKKDLSEYAFEDDAARVKLGAPWRIPTVNECSELINECEWVWSSRNGIHGYEVTGPNGNVIFLSAAGNWYYGGYTLSGYCGDYWTSSIASPETGNELFFNSQGQYIMGTQRPYGNSIRPVFAE